MPNAFKNNISAKKSILIKYVRVTTLVVFSCFAVLGIVLLLFVSNFWEEDKKSSMKENADNTATYIEEIYLHDLSTDGLRVDSIRLTKSLQLFRKLSGTEYLLCTPDGLPVVSTNFFKHILTPSPTYVPGSVLEIIWEEGQYVGTSNLGGLYDTQKYVVGVPVHSSSAIDNQHISFFIFVSSDIGTAGEFQKNFLQILLIAAIIGSLVSFFAIWMLTYRLVQPLREMSVAALRFGNGDFSRRIVVRSEDEIGQLALALNNMASSLSVEESMRRSFIANVSHELKTPMTTIAGFIDGILDGVIPPERQSYYLKTVSDEVKRLSRLVRSMLDLTRIDSGELSLNPTNVELTNILLTTALLFEQKIDEKNLEIQGLDELVSVQVYGDHDLIHQVIYNLMENAVKFTPQGGFIRISVTEHSGRVYTTLRNRCAGLAPEELPLIFDRFYKTDSSRSQDKNGIGLGLYLSKTIIRLHGGAISAQVPVPDEVEFTFWLPKGKEHKSKIRRHRSEDNVKQEHEKSDNQHDMKDGSDTNPQS